MVRALLDGSKTQTRRVMKPQPRLEGNQWHWREYEWNSGKRHPVDVYDFNPNLAPFGSLYGSLKPCPYGKPGDKLWVREAWRWASSEHDIAPAIFKVRTVDAEHRTRWKSAIHMPRSICRILLEITHVRVERLWGITEADALAEGMASMMRGCTRYDGEATDLFIDVWEKLHGPGSWSVNPWVWVIQFKKAIPDREGMA